MVPVHDPDLTTPDYLMDDSDRVVGCAFRICSSSRWFGAGSFHTWRLALSIRRFSTWPRLSFWLRILQEIGLMDKSICLPTSLAPGWFELPRDQQMKSLLDAWVNSPQTAKIRQTRARLIRNILASDAESRYMKALNKQGNGLRALGILEGNKLTPAAEKYFRKEPPTSGLAEAPSWWLDQMSLVVPDPANYRLLWDLETYFQPYRPGRYSLLPADLRLAAQKGDRFRLVKVLEQGLGNPLTDELKAHIEGQPTVRLLTGFILEFYDPT